MRRGEEPSALLNGFWPKTRQEDAMNGMFMNDGNVREEFDEDSHYIGEIDHSQNAYLQRSSQVVVCSTIFTRFAITLHQHCCRKDVESTKPRRCAMPGDRSQFCTASPDAVTRPQLPATSVKGARSFASCKSTGAFNAELLDLECIPFPVTMTTVSGASSPQTQARRSSSSQTSNIVMAAPTDNLHESMHTCLILSCLNKK